MHCPWTRKTRAWGYEVIRGIDEDDPRRVIRAFRHPVGLAFVDLNAQVEIDYGGYAWTQWMHKHFGDTALHIALKWKRHRAVKALLSLRPDWTLHNEAGVTAEQLVLRIYGKSMENIKAEQEREYENDAMRAEEEAMKSLMAAEAAARERARLQFLQELHAARTLGVEREAAILFEHGRVVLAQEEPSFDKNRGGGTSASAATSAADTGRWVSHVCRELRRNRFAAQRGAMRRNVVPAIAPPCTSPGGRAASRARAGTPSFSPPARIDGSSYSPTRTRTGTGTRSRKDMRSPTSAKSARVSSGKGKRRANGTDTAPSNAASGNGNEEREGGHILFDTSSAVGSGRWPCVDVAASKPKIHAGGRTRSRSPAQPVSPLGASTRAKSPRGRGRNGISSPISDDGLSIMSGSTWGGGRSIASPGRFDRSSRMSTMRTTRILAAGKTLRRPTPEGRLQRKMAARSAVTAKQAAPSTTFLVSPRSLLLPAPRITAKQDGDPSCANSGCFAAVHRAEKDGPVHGGGDNSGPGTVYLGESGAVVAARDSEEQKSTTGARHPQGTCGDVAAAGRSPTNNRTNHNATGSSDNVDDVDHDDDRDKPNHGQNEIRDDSKRSDGRDGCSPRRDPATVPLPWKKADGAPDAIARSSGAEEEKDCPPPAPEKEGVKTTLGGVGEGPMRDVLAALLTSTVMTEDGGRVLVPTFPTISALQELKYCGPVEPLQASVLQRVLLARPGVLVRLNLLDKRIGDRGAVALAPALAGVRSVDLQRNNIGDTGTIAIASALRDATATATVVTAATTAVSNGEERERTPNRLCVLESLSLAGNRIGDAGAEALSVLLEEAGRGEESEQKKRGEEKEAGRASPMPMPSTAGPRFLGWLSIAGNPCVSDNSKQRLLRAGTNRRRLLYRGEGGDNDPPAMVIIV